MPLLSKPIFVGSAVGLFLFVSCLTACSETSSQLISQRIAFTSIRDGDFEIYVMNADQHGLPMVAVLLSPLPVAKIGMFILSTLTELRRAA